MRRHTLRASVASVALAAAVTLPALADVNGKLPSSELAEIYCPAGTCYLRKDAAAAWNAMRAYCRARGTDLYPAGVNSAYRTYAQQVMMKRLYGSNAATPGTSNHGLGIAVDLASMEMRRAIDQYGAQFGWSKRWSDASWEWWHIKYKAGVWDGRNAQPAFTADEGLPPPTPPAPSASPSSDTGSGGGTASAPSTPSDASSSGDGSSSPSVGISNALDGSGGSGATSSDSTDTSSHPQLSRGDSGAAVKDLQRLLNQRGYSVSVDGDFGPSTERAVQRFQRAKKLGADGVVGPKTWQALQSGTPAASRHS